jgi:hypothetical protein
MKRALGFFSMGLFLLISLAVFESARAAVTLVSFNAYPDNVNLKISLFWETGSELDFSGFYIERSLSADTGFDYLGDEFDQPVFIPAQGLGSGAQYSHDDTKVDVGVLYYYRLDMLDPGGEVSYSDVVSTTLGNKPTPTVTPSPTRTRTPTSTYTRTASSTVGSPGPSSTATMTPTPTQTRTKTHQPTLTMTRTPTPYHVVTYTSAPIPSKTPTETSTATLTPSDTPTATTTLIPLPSLTLLFSVRTQTPTFTPSPSQTETPILPTFTPTPKLEPHISLQTSFLGGIIALLWVTLAGFLLVYFKRMSKA